MEMVRLTATDMTWQRFEVCNPNQKTAFENLMKRMTASNQNIDPNTFWNTYNQSKANLHSVINQNALTHYIPVQIRITLENALKKYNAIQVIGCEGYRKLKKIANRKF